MNDRVEDFKIYLPKYLSQEATADLFEELSQFPKNIDGRIYTMRLKNEPAIFQGDGLGSLWVSNLPSETIKKTRVMVLSNSCDIDPNNERLIGPRLLYCPIINLRKYEETVRAKSNVTSQRLADHINGIRSQKNSSMFYLPKYGGLEYEGIAMLDRINNCDAQAVNVQELVANRLFTLSDYGFYLFIFKLSLHLTRIREAVSRT